MIRVADMIATVSAMTGTPRKLIVSRSRAAYLVRLRSAIVHEAYRQGHSYPHIGRRLGGRDHSTVISADRNFEEYCDTDPKFRAFAARFREALAEVAAFASDRQIEHVRKALGDGDITPFAAPSGIACGGGIAAEEPDPQAGLIQAQHNFEAKMIEGSKALLTALQAEAM